MNIFSSSTNTVFGLVGEYTETLEGNIATISQSSFDSAIDSSENNVATISQTFFDVTEDLSLVPSFSLPNLPVIGVVNGVTAFITNASPQLIGSSRDDYLQGNSGANSQNDVFFGLNGSDQIFGGAGNDIIYGGGGLVDTGDSGDLIVGGSGRDFIYGNAGNDTIIGGNDFTDIQDAADILVGGRGNDFILGNAGDDRLFGMEGNDTMHGGLGDDTFVFTRDNGNDFIAGFEAGDTLSFVAGIAGGTFQSAADVLAATRSTSGQTEIDLGVDGTITFYNGFDLTAANIEIVTDLGIATFSALA